MSSSNINAAKALDSFTREIANLKTLQPITKLGQFSRKIIDLTSSSSKVVARNESIYEQIRGISNQAAIILEKIPEDIRDVESLGNKLRNETTYQVLSDDKKIVLSHKELEQFYKDMHVLFTEIYPKVEGEAFTPDPDFKMPKIVQEYLSPELKRLRKEKSELKQLRKEKSDGENLSKEHTTQRKIAKGQLAIATGHGIKRNKGATGTLIIKDINGKSVGIHKVSESDVPLLTRFKNLIKSFFGGQLTYLSKKNLAQPLSERAAYLISKDLGFGVAPSSFKVEMKGIVGVFQIFLTREKENQGVIDDVKGAISQMEGVSLVEYPEGKGPRDYLEAREVIDEWNKKKNFTENEKLIFQKFILFDFIIGNLDRHEENWFVTISKDNEITNIKAIDNANAFPKKQPGKRSMATKNQYKWKTLELAKQNFSEKTIEFVKTHLTEGKVDEMIETLKQDMPGFLDADMERLLRTRIRVVSAFLLLGNQSPAALAECSTETEMNNFLNRL